MPDGMGVEVKGLADFRRALKDVDKKLPRMLTKAAKEAAELVAAQARTDSAGGTNQQALLAKTIRASATATSARLLVGNNTNLPFALSAFLGSRSRTGWYSKDRYAGSAGKQFPPWVGNQWNPGESWDGHANGEPYIIGGSIRTVKEAFIDRFATGIDDVMHEAFPD